MILNVLLICLVVTIVVMIAVEACRNMKGAVSILGVYLPIPTTIEESSAYDPDDYDFELESSDPSPPMAPPEISRKIRRKFFDIGPSTKPQPTEDDPEFMKHVESRMPRRSPGN